VGIWVQTDTCMLKLFLQQAFADKLITGEQQA